MTITTDPGIDFWLEYVAAEGGLHERAGDTTLVVLPESLQVRHDRDSEMTVTADPDVAREDRAVLMTVGHPLLTAAAESVLGEGDVGAVRLARPAFRTPDAGQLQQRARDRIDVDHGRVDITGGPYPSVRHVVRVSSLATFAMSSDDRFQEQMDCWVDVPSGRPLAVNDERSLAGLVGVEHAERDQLDPDHPGLARALVAADVEIGRRAEARRQTLGDAVGPAFRSESDRARDYYDQMAQSLRRRMASAAPDKVAGYAARLEHCRAERDRRLAEIAEKYRSSVQYLPFRLHLVGVPALRVDAGIRRGNRWYPVDLEWLAPTRGFAPIACPGCGSGEPLVAGKDGLGCRRCRPPRLLGPVPEPPQGGRTAAAPGGPTGPGRSTTSAGSSAPDPRQESDSPRDAPRLPTASARKETSGGATASTGTVTSTGKAAPTGKTVPTGTAAPTGKAVSTGEGGPDREDGIDRKRGVERQGNGTEGGAADVTADRPADTGPCQQAAVGELSDPSR